MSFQLLKPLAADLFDAEGEYHFNFTSNHNHARGLLPLPS